LATNQGELTRSGVDTIGQISASLRQATLQGVYGCPDCADGGASVIRLLEATTESTIAYGFGDAPAELEEADEVTQSLIRALTTCTSSELITPEGNCVRNP
jgi:hypothetical protein